MFHRLLEKKFYEILTSQMIYALKMQLQSWKHRAKAKKHAGIEILKSEIILDIMKHNKIITLLGGWVAQKKKNIK